MSVTNYFEFRLLRNIFLNQRVHTMPAIDVKYLVEVKLKEALKELGRSNTLLFVVWREEG